MGEGGREKGEGGKEKGEGGREKGTVDRGPWTVGNGNLKPENGFDNQSVNQSITHSLIHSFTHSFPVTVPVLGYVLAGSLCTYNHHFSLLFAFIVGVTGLFFLNRSNRWRYLLANLAIIVLYLPHLPVFFTQFGMGGIGDWLQKPRYDFFFDYVKYIFHFSVFSYLLVLVLISLGLYWYYDACEPRAEQRDDVRQPEDAGSSNAMQGDMKDRTSRAGQSGQLTDDGNRRPESITDVKDKSPETGTAEAGSDPSVVQHGPVDPGGRDMHRSKMGGPGFIYSRLVTLLRRLRMYRDEKPAGDARYGTSPAAKLPRIKDRLHFRLPRSCKPWMSEFLPGSVFRYMLISLAWFLIPYLIGFFYSRYVNPVIQFSVLIFSFPFLFFVLFGWIREATPVRKGVFVALIAVISVTSLILERNHYNLFYRSPYREMLTEARAAVDSLGAKNCQVILDTKPKINQYYLDKLNLHDLSFIPAGSIGNRGKLASFLHASKKPYLIYGCISAVPWENYAIMNREYPWLLKHITWAGGDFYVFSRESAGDVREGRKHGSMFVNPVVRHTVPQKQSGDEKPGASATRDDSPLQGTPVPVTETRSSNRTGKLHPAPSPEAFNPGSKKGEVGEGLTNREITRGKAAYGRVPADQQVSHEYFRGFANTFEPPATEWGYVDTANLCALNPIEGDTSWVDNEGLEFSPTFRKPLWEMIRSGSDIIDIWVDMEAPLVFPGAWLVATVMSGDAYIYWNSAPAGDFFRPGGKGRLFYSLRMCDIDLRHPDLVMTAFIWNPAKGKYKIDNFTVMVRRGNPLIYGLYRKIPER